MKSIVTGAARGLGERIAERLVSDGGDVALVDVDDDVGLDRGALADDGPGLSRDRVCDVTSPTRRPSDRWCARCRNVSAGSSCS